MIINEQGGESATETTAEQAPPLPHARVPPSDVAPYPGYPALPRAGSPELGSGSGICSNMGCPLHSHARTEAAHAAGTAFYVVPLRRAEKGRRSPAIPPAPLLLAGGHTPFRRTRHPATEHALQRLGRNAKLCRTRPCRPGGRCESKNSCD
jgi:hypothetical protein